MERLKSLLHKGFMTYLVSVSKQKIHTIIVLVGTKQKKIAGFKPLALSNVRKNIQPLASTNNIKFSITLIITEA